MKVSILVNNYNYGAYVEAAIESALAQTWPDTEVIVVDDGSTDQSRERLARFGARCRVILQENGGQGAAYNTGFAACSGEIVIFLDADDLLLPDAVQQIVQAWTPGLAKVHFRLALMDWQGASLPGSIPGAFQAGDVRQEVLAHGCYASAPGSGNAYAAEALRHILPMPAGQWRIAADAYTITLAPFWGEVGTLDTVLGRYRIGRKADTFASKFVFNNSPATPWESLQRSFQSLDAIRHELQQRQLLAAGAHFRPVPAVLKLRLVSLKFFRAHHCVAHDSLVRAVTAGVSCVLRWQPYRLPSRIAYATWFVLVGLLPRALAKWPALLLLNPDFRRRVLHPFASHQRASLP